MHYYLWRSITVTTSLVILGVLLQENKPANIQYNISLKEKKKVIWQIVEKQFTSEINTHVEAFKKMQRKLPALQHANYTLLAGASPKEKKLLTVGITSVQHPHGSYLLDTLKSIFQASRDFDLEYIRVLVLLSSTDPKWLNQTVANIAGLFIPYIEAGRLLVVHGLLGGSSGRSTRHFSPCGKIYSRQNTDLALLMNFAHNLSDYILLLEDNIQCTPRFVSAIYWTLSFWKELPWVILEFSSLGVSGKVFHTSDLFLLTSLFLLFPKDTPTHLLLSEFRLLLAQNVPVRFSHSIFHYNNSESEDTSCFPVEEDKAAGEPDNPVATVITSMVSLWNTVPQYAYILNDECFAINSPLKGNFLLVILDRPQKIIRIAVLTGFHDTGMYYLLQGQVFLGYDLMDYPKRCTHYNLVGPLIRGNLDQRVYYEEGSVEEMTCIKLLVLESQDSWLMIRQIRVWTEMEEEQS